MLNLASVSWWHANARLWRNSGEISDAGRGDTGLARFASGMHKWLPSKLPATVSKSLLFLLRICAGASQLPALFAFRGQLGEDIHLYNLDLAASFSTWGPWPRHSVSHRRWLSAVTVDLRVSLHLISITHPCFYLLLPELLMKFLCWSSLALAPRLPNCYVYIAPLRRVQAVASCFSFLWYLPKHSTSLFFFFF